MRACECASECVCIKWLFGLSLIYWAFIYVHRLQIMAKCVYLSERESLIIFYVHTHTHRIRRVFKRLPTLWEFQMLRSFYTIVVYVYGVCSVASLLALAFLTLNTFFFSLLDTPSIDKTKTILFVNVCSIYLFMILVYSIVFIQRRTECVRCN